jgi:hypothetical protein
LGTTRGVDAVYQSTVQEERIVKLLKDEKEIEIEIVKA